MIRVLALYSQAKYLAWFLKALLGLETVIGALRLFYGIAIAKGELVIN